MLFLIEKKTLLSVLRRYLEKQLLLHHGVSDVAIRGVEVQGVGQVQFKAFQEVGQVEFKGFKGSGWTGRVQRVGKKEFIGVGEVDFKGLERQSSRG